MRIRWKSTGGATPLKKGGRGYLNDEAHKRWDIETRSKSLSRGGARPYAERFSLSVLVTTTLGLFLISGLPRNKAASASARVIGYGERGNCGLPAAILGSNHGGRMRFIKTALNLRYKSFA